MSLAFTRQLFGYQRDEVKRKISSLEVELSKARERLENYEKDLAQMEATNEQLEVQVASLRRQRVQLSSSTQVSQPVVVMIGPSTSLGSITALIDEIESCAEISVQFRAFRDGYYRVDGYCDSHEVFLEWLRSRENVADVLVQGESMHVVPRGAS